jgi:large subunit ribosomal protein L21
MYAVIATGGKQYKVAKDQSLKIEMLEGDVGKKIELPALMISDGKQVLVGAPYIDKRMVQAEIIGHGRHKKVKIVKMRRRKHSRKQMGHRQYFTEIKITAI